MKYLLCVLVIGGFLLTSCKDNSSGPKGNYKVNVSVSPDGAGTITRSVEGPYPAFSTVELTAHPNEGYMFVKWTGDVPTADSTVVVLADQDHSLTAEYRKAVRVHSFHLAPNGITIVCDDADFGTYDFVGEKRYVKRKADEITPDNAAGTCTSGITDMTEVFYHAEDFNGDISSWDMSNVTSMYKMFYYAESFNQDISEWDVSNVETLHKTFYGAESFNQDISDWDVSKVTSLYETFYKAYAFNQDIGSWDVSKVTDMYKTFKYAEAFNQNINSWDVSHVTDMKETFEHAESFNQPLDNWDVGNVTRMYKMFKYAYAFNQDIGSWDVSQVTDMKEMFEHATSFDQDLSGWCVPSVTDHGSFAADTPIEGDQSKLPAWGTCPQL